MEKKTNVQMPTLPKELEEPLPAHFPCPICSAHFPSRLGLRDHMALELEIQPELLNFLEIDLNMPVTAPPTCSEETQDVTCGKCSKVCKGIRGYNQHYGKVHLRKKRHAVCKTCGNTFRNKYALRFHVKQVHDAATRVQCEICGLVVYNKYILPSHMKKIHFDLIDNFTN